MERTSSLDPYEPESSGYDWDYGEPETRGGRPKVLWGRIGALAGALVVAFLIGRASAPNVDTSLEADNVELKQANEELAEENRLLEEQIRNLPADNPTPQDTQSPEGEEVVYEVKPGDTLRGIAQEFYGDPECADFLAAANGIDDPTALSVGEELTIPADPGDCAA